MAHQVVFLSTRFDRMPTHEAIRQLLVRLLERQGGRIFYANAHTLVTASRNKPLANALSRSDLLLADGSGVLWGSLLQRKPLTYNLNGTDLVPNLCQVGASKGLSIYLLGAKPGVAEQAARNLASTFPGLKIAGVRDGYFDRSETEAVLEDIRKAHPHLLLVAMGVPLQELWIDQHVDQLPGITCMGVGGLFDFVANRVPRAPQWVRQVGMEWLWRMLMEPTRLWQRYTIGNFKFMLLLLEDSLKAWREIGKRV
ncbi:MAG: WecB/TagA/CpsF family glycosyltransferase [Thainema sp.]